MAGSATLELLLRARDEASAQLARLRGELQETERSSFSLGDMLKSAGAAALGFAAAIAGMQAVGTTFGFVKDAVIGMNASLETSTLQFTTLMGNAEQARKHVEGLFRFAAETPFETGPIIEASRLLQTFGGSALNTEGNLRLVGDAAAATSNQINEVAFWVGRAYSLIQAGKPFGEAAMRLQEMGILSAEARARLEELQKSGASGAEVWAAFQEELSRFSGAMKLQANTWQGLTSTIKDNLQMLAATAFRPLFDLLKEGAKALADFLQSDRVQAFAQRAAAALARLIEQVKKFISGVVWLIRNGPLFWQEIVPDDKALRLWDRFAIVIATAWEAARLFIATLRGDLPTVVLHWRQLDELGLTPVANVLLDIGTIVRTVIPLLRDLVAEAGKRVWADFQSVLAAIKNQFQSIGDKVPGATSAVTAFVTRLAENKEDLQKVADILAKALEAWLGFLAVKQTVTLTQQIVRTGDEFIKDVRNLAHTITQVVRRVGEFIGDVRDVTQAIVQNVVRTGDKFIEITQPVVRQTVEQVVKVTAPPAEMLKRLGIGIGTSLGQGIAQGIGMFLGIALAPVLVTALGGISVGALAVAGLALAAAIVGALILAFPQQFGQVVGIVTGFFVKFLTTSVFNALSIMETVWVEIPKAVVRAIVESNIGAELQQFFTSLFTLDIAGAIRAGGAILHSVFMEIVPGIVTGVAQAFGKMVQDVALRFADLVGITDVNWAEIGSKIKGALDDVKGFFGRWAGEFTQGFRQRFSEIAGESAQKWEEIRQKVEEVLGNIRTAVGNAWQDVKDTIARLAGEARDRVTEAFDNMRHWVVDRVQSLKDGAIAKLGELLDWIRGLPGQILAALGDLGGLLWDAGRALIEGLIAGIRSKIPDLKDALGGLKDMLPDWKGPLEDDRRLLIPAGRAVMEGLMAGISGELPALRELLGDVTGAIAGLGAAPARPLAVASAPAPVPVAAGPSYTFNITINATSYEGGRQAARGFYDELRARGVVP